MPVDILKTISYAGTMEVLDSLEKGPKRFSEIMFETRLNPGILNRVLKALTGSGLVAKCASGEGYELTGKGAKILVYVRNIVADHNIVAEHNIAAGENIVDKP